MALKPWTSEAGYLSAAGGWANTSPANERRSVQTAWRFALLALLIAALNGSALLLSPPRAKLVVFKVEGARSSPNSLPVEAIAPGSLHENPAFTQASLARYVAAREEFSASRLVDDFRLVALFSGTGVRKAYVASLKRSSGTSVVALYPLGAIVSVRIKGVSLLDRQRAIVRFDLIRSDLFGAQPTSGEAFLKYAYSAARMRTQDRWINPLGLQILDYQRQDGG